MSMYLVNILLAVLWASVAGEFTATTLVAGFVLGHAVLFLARPILGPSPYFKRVWQGFAFMGFFVRELIASSLRIAYDVLTPAPRMSPGVIGVPLSARTDMEITLFANLVSLTPGTLSLDISPDRRVLYIHVMYIDGGDVEAVRRELKQELEQRVLALLR